MEAGNRGRRFEWRVCGVLRGRGRQWTDAGKETEVAVEQVTLVQVYGCGEEDS